MFPTTLDRWLPLEGPAWLQLLLLLAAVGAVAWLARALARLVLTRVVASALHELGSTRLELVLNAKALARFANIAPALVVYAAADLLPDDFADAGVVVRNVALSLAVVAGALAFDHVLDGVSTCYERTSHRSHERPIKGFVQMAKILVFAVAAVIAVAVLVDRSPWMLLSGFGAVSAVLLLVFKDSILSLVASVQLTTNDMLRVGDWIEMPALGADGEVIDMALNTVKVQNWDKTITTIPTYRLMSESFCNWRGMQESGGRRIKRALRIDQTSIRFLDPEERASMRRIALIDGYLDRKREELEAYNAHLAAIGQDPINTRQVTNIGTFRAYVEAYLHAHPDVRDDMTVLARQLEPDATGLPLEVYCFAEATDLERYEAIQADIFDHLIAMLPCFGLRLFQQPGGADVVRLLDGRRAADEGANTWRRCADGNEERRAGGRS